MSEYLEILKLVNEQRGFDFSGYRMSMVERRTNKRLIITHCNNSKEYLSYLYSNPEEIDNLIQEYTIHVSRFFRNALTFEFIRKFIIPEISRENPEKNKSNLRIWSAGCSFGEEPYSMAILFKEYMEKEKISPQLNIFATDIDKKALERAVIGQYPMNSIKNVKYELIEKYFTQKGNLYEISPSVRHMVQFSFSDLLDKKSTSPPESIYGNFDIILCRNVLIYFEPDYQKIIFNKLYKSLNQNGYLILGEAEMPLEDYKNNFKAENDFCKIFRKIN